MATAAMTAVAMLRVPAMHDGARARRRSACVRACRALVAQAVACPLAKRTTEREARFL